MLFTADYFAPKRRYCVSLLIIDNEPRLMNQTLFASLRFSSSVFNPCYSTSFFNPQFFKCRFFNPQLFNHAFFKPQFFKFNVFHSPSQSKHPLDGWINAFNASKKPEIKCYKALIGCNGDADMSAVLLVGDANMM